MSHPSAPLPLGAVTVTDPFWHAKQELVRTQVIPYQWEALNDRVPGAAPSYVIHNFAAAARQRDRRTAQGAAFKAPTLTNRGFETWPEDSDHPDPDTFYGLVFQDSDLAKFIEAAAYSLAGHPDATLEAEVDAAIDLICSAQLDNGYLCTYYILTGMDQHFTNLEFNHELYCFGHMTEAAVAYHEATGKDALLEAMKRFADYIDSRFGPQEGKLKGYPGHEEAELALVRLHQATGEQRYLDLAKFFLDQRGTDPKYFHVEAERAKAEGYPRAGWDADMAYFQSHEPVREQDEAVGHAVRAGYLYTGMADVARETGDQSLVEACERLWRSIVDRKLYVTGGIGGTVDGEAFSYDYDLPNDLAYSETCAAISLVYFARRMLQLRPRSEYADVMELALYNTVLAGVALDGKSFFYVNPLEVTPEGSAKDSRKRHVKPVRQPWFGCACCPPNLARTVADVASYAWTATDDTLFTHLYVGGQVSAELSGSPVRLDVTASLPWSGEGSAVLHCGSGATGTLAFRLPGWSDADDAALSASAEADGRISREVVDGYVYFTGTWRDGDTVSFDFPMPARVLAANPAVREDTGKVALARGPITFTFEEADNGADLHLLRLDPQALEPGGIAVEPWQGLGEPMVRLRVPVRRLPAAQDAPLYSAYRPQAGQAGQAYAIPYYGWANRGENEMSVWIRA